MEYINFLHVQTEKQKSSKENKNMWKHFKNERKKENKSLTHNSTNIKQSREISSFLCIQVSWTEKSYNNQFNNTPLTKM